jgi:DNA-binding MarR family transcriptional regulator
MDDDESINNTPIQSLLPYKLYHISAIHERIAYANMTRMTGVTLPEWRIMGNIASGIDSFTELTKELVVDPGQLSNSIKQLQAKGLLEKRKSTIDRRQTILSLSALGKEKKVFILDMAKAYEDMALAGLDKGQIETLNHALATVESNIRNFWREHNGDQ